MRVVVIGSGIAGLSAAHDLRKAGFEVVVLERDAQAGGRMAETMLGSLRVNTGASVLFSFYDDMLRLIRELGLERHIQYLPAGQNLQVANGSREYSIDAASTLGLLAHPAFG